MYLPCNSTHCSSIRFLPAIYLTSLCNSYSLISLTSLSHFTPLHYITLSNPSTSSLLHTTFPLSSSSLLYTTLPSPTSFYILFISFYILFISSVYYYSTSKVDMAGNHPHSMVLRGPDVQEHRERLFDAGPEPPGPQSPVSSAAVTKFRYSPEDCTCSYVLIRVYQKAFHNATRKKGTGTRHD